MKNSRIHWALPFLCVSTILILWNLGCTLSPKSETDSNSERSPAQQGSFIKNRTALFDSYVPLEVKMTAPLTTLFSRRARPNAFNPPEILNFSVDGTLEYTNQSGAKVQVPLKIKLRGNTSQSERECPFPKMKLKFQERQIQGTLFEGNKDLNLGTHCGTGGGQSPEFGRSWNPNSVEREVFAYRMLDILDIPSFKARSVKIRYVNSENPGQYSHVFPGFFLEEMSAVTARHQGVEIRNDRGYGGREENNPRVEYGFRTLADYQISDFGEIAKVLYFQELINNPDWIIAADRYGSGIWNMKVFRHGSPRKYVVMPYDFDIAYFVSQNERWKYSSGSNMGHVFTSDQKRQAREFFAQRRGDLERATADLLPANRTFVMQQIRVFYDQMR